MKTPKQSPPEPEAPPPPPPKAMRRYRAEAEAKAIIAAIEPRRGATGTLIAALKEAFEAGMRGDTFVQFEKDDPPPPERERQHLGIR